MSGFELKDPWMLLLLLLVPVLAWRLFRRPAAPAILFPTLVTLRDTRRTLRQRLLFLVPLMQLLAVVGLVIAAARPRLGDDKSVIRRQGIAIEMVLDRSSSMNEPMPYKGEMVPRIDIVKDVFADFVAGNEELPGRKSDLIGLTTFAQFAEESCPLVTLHEPILAAVANLQTVMPFLNKFREPTFNRAQAVAQNPMDGTALWDGLYRAILSTIVAEEDLARGEEDDGYQIKGKVAIVLTDGQRNAGRGPVEVAEYAKANGIKVYPIVFLSRNVAAQTILGMQVQQQLSEAQMAEVMSGPRKVAEITGGLAFLAEDGDALQQIYSEIDQLERTDVGRIEYRTYYERFHWLLIPAMGLIGLATLLGETWLRRIP